MISHRPPQKVKVITAKVMMMMMMMMTMTTTTMMMVMMIMTMMTTRMTMMVVVVVVVVFYCKQRVKQCRCCHDSDGPRIQSAIPFGDKFHKMKTP